MSGEIGHRRGPIKSSKMNYIQDNLVSNEVQGMIVGYGVGLGSDERTILYGCSNHKEGPEHEATVH